MEGAAARDARNGRDDRSGFERFVEATYRRISGAGFFFVCAVLVVAWLISYPLFADAKSWQVVIHTVTSVLTLLMLALLENASRRAEEAAQEKLNVLADALASLMDSRGADDPDLREAAARLRDAVGLEERH
jgi:low affinity Fe/Cu permease